MPNNILLFDGGARDRLLPLTFTKPVSELRIGILRISEKWAHEFNTQISWLTEDYLSGKFPISIGDTNILIKGNLLPDKGLVQAFSELKDGQALIGNGNVLGIGMTADQLSDLSGNKDAPMSIHGYDVVHYEHEYKSIEFPWDLFAMNGEEIENDFERLTAGKTSAAVEDSVQVIGDRLFVEEGARIGHSILNTEEGPIYIGKNAEVMEGCLIRGPFTLGEKAVLKMGTKVYGATTVGPYCKVGGEVNNSIFTGFSNKAHDGFVGNSVIGEWCNMGADTNTSNLKNDYGSVKCWSYEGGELADSGRQFLGLVMGDHSKSSINTMFNTGTVVGVNANVFTGKFPPKFVPSFSWLADDGNTEYRLDKAISVATQVMKRRNVELDESDQTIFNTVFDLTKKYRDG